MSKDSFVMFNHELKWSFHQDAWCFSAPVGVHGRLLTLGGSKGVVHTGAIHMFYKVSCSWTVIGLIPAPKCAIGAVTIADNGIIYIMVSNSILILCGFANVNYCNYIYIYAHIVNVFFK